ncbi:MAG: hypothetical protein Q8O16_01270 [Dehalococcoidia bacterium]|nr:hypothetical protein [Dehalococcoidia bacterium]
MWFWKKKTGIKTKPTSIPGFVGARIVTEMQKLPHTSDHWVKLKGVMRSHAGGSSTAFDIRVFDEWEADEKKVKVIDYAFLDQHPDLIQYEGWFDKASKKVEITMQRAAV